MNFFELILKASPVVQLVLLILLFFSVFSWAVIFFKRSTLKAASIKSKKFLEVFHQSQNLTEVNEAVADSPETINQSPFEDGWLFRMTPSDAGELDALMDAATYEDLVASEEH